MRTSLLFNFQSLVHHLVPPLQINKPSQRVQAPSLTNRSEIMESQEERGVGSQEQIPGLGVAVDLGFV